MEFKFAYFVWALLPLFYLWFIAASYFNEDDQGSTRDTFSDYLKTWLFLVANFGLAIGVDLLVYNHTDWVQMIGENEFWVLDFLIYPLVLLISAQLVSSLQPKKEKKSKVNHIF